MKSLSLRGQSFFLLLGLWRCYATGLRVRSWKGAKRPSWCSHSGLVANPKRGALRSGRGQHLLWGTALPDVGRRSTQGDLLRGRQQLSNAVETVICTHTHTYTSLWVCTRFWRSVRKHTEHRCAEHSVLLYTGHHGHDLGDPGRKRLSRCPWITTPIVLHL